ncbi:hypothetical protein HMPREF9057_02311, partial [Actinomyces sp. oral taxon 171 str. F0337]
ALSLLRTRLRAAVVLYATFHACIPILHCGYSFSVLLHSEEEIPQ